MNKKFLSAILFGALMVSSTGTFVSCKDYDDDIDHLQEQIDKLATKEDMSSQIATLQAALTAAAKDASDAIAKATAAEAAAKKAGDEAAAAKAAAEKSVAEAKAAAIEGAKAEVEKAKAELQKLVEAGLAENKAELQKMAKKVEEATKKVEKIVGEISSIVTSVELVDSYSASNKQELGKDLSFATAEVLKDVTFQKVNKVALPGSIEFKKGDQDQTTDKFVVRVSPTNAVLTPEMISLVNSKGDNLDDFLVVEKVEKFNGLLSRAVSETGLWEVTVKLKEYKEDVFNATTMVDPSKGAVAKNMKLFAVQVNNTQATTEGRFATSSFDLAIKKGEYNPVGRLDFFVNGTSITDINNRVKGQQGKSLTADDVITYEELHWKDHEPSYDVNKNTAVAAITQDGDDNRSNKNLLLAVQGQKIKIELAKSLADYNNLESPAEIRAIYVTLDKQNAVQSLNSEINAWNSYTYTGLDQVVEGTSTTISVDANFSINDMIGFRVWAVNRNGQLVDPDGRAFYVQIGDAGIDWNAAATVIVPDAKVSTLANVEKSNEVAVSLTEVKGASFEWSTDKIGDNEKVFHVYFKNAKNEEKFNTLNGNVTGLNFKDLVKVYTMPTIGDWTKYEDNKTYNGTLKIKDQTGFVIATLNVSMTKELPTTIPAGFSIKTAQVKDGIYNCYMVPMTDYSTANGVPTWAYDNANVGSMPMSQIFNFGKGVDSQYEIAFATSQKDNNGKDVTKMVTGDKSIEVAKAYIDATTKHATTIVYNYGKISSDDKLNGKQEDGTFLGYQVAATDKFETIYNCIYNSTYTWSWATHEQLGKPWTEKKDGKYVYPLPSTEIEYGKEYVVKNPKEGHLIYLDSVIFGTSAWDGIYSHLMSQQKNKVGAAEEAVSINILEATFTSDANGKEEYFKPVVEEKNGYNHITKLVVLPESSNPTADVPSTLNIKYADMYGHEHTAHLKMVVKQRK